MCLRNFVGWAPRKPLPGSNLRRRLAPTWGGQDGARQPTGATTRWTGMRRLGRRTGWLGWAVAGVLVVSAGGAALAAQDATTTTQAPSVGAGRDKARAG